MLTILWISGLVRYRRARLVVATIGVAIAVGLLATIGIFLSTSKSTMTNRAASSVSTDWQIAVQPNTEPSVVRTALQKDRVVKGTTEVNFGSTTGFELSKDGTVQTTGPGVVLGLPASYRSTFSSSIRTLAGAGTGVLLAQQTAANLRATVGDTIMIGRAELPSVRVHIDGIVDLPSADSFFQTVGAPPNAQATAPPDNVLIVSPPAWRAMFDPLGASRPDLVRTQFHSDYVAPLPADPSAAFRQVTADAQNLELRLQGGGLVGNNLGAELGKARADSLYAQVLFLFLGMPGAVLAGLLTATVAASGADRRRRDQALLRARGATIRQLVTLGSAEAAFVAIIGAAGGLGLALFIGAVRFHSATFGASSTTLFIWSVVAMITGALITGVSMAWPTYRDAKEVTVSAARRPIGRGRPPRWLRWKVDGLVVLGAAVTFWATSRNGFKLVLAVEGVPQISVNYWAFAGPALAWGGAGMVLWRVSNALLATGRRGLPRWVKPISGNLSSTVSSAMRRQAPLLSRSLVLTALTVAFAASTSVFNATYKHQAEVDAVLSNGAMVSVVESPGVIANPSQQSALAAVPGVRSVTALQHRFAYVGADLQDLYGVDPTTIVRATKLQDAYFAGGSAKALMAKLATKRDGILVSDETVKDFQLNPGDTLRLRLQNGKTKQYVPVSFTYVGIAKEFPSAPSDSFLVANASYVAEATGTAAVGTFLIDTASSDSTTVAARVQRLVGTDAMVNDVASDRRKIGNSLTAVELKGLTKVELGFALVLAAAASGLVIWIGLSERRRMFAIASALGARPRQLGSFVWSEAAYVTVVGALLGALTGWVITEMIVKVLTGVFDPPPSALTVPWGYLGGVATVSALAVLLAATSALRSTRRPAVELLRDL